MSLIDILFPQFCFGCGRLGSYLCLLCQKKLEAVSPVCFYCRRPSPHGLTHQNCKKTNGIDGFVSLYSYTFIFQRILKKIKYALITHSAREIFPILLFAAIEPLSFYKKTFKNLVLQPVPQSYARENWRGFNQSVVLSNYISLLFSIPAVDFVVKTKQTTPQVEAQSHQKRRSNIRGAFTTKIKNTQQTNILIVDDVVTSGSTANEVALSLKRSGTGCVFVFSLACS